MKLFITSIIFTIYINEISSIEITTSKCLEDFNK